MVRQEKVSGRSREGRTELETILDFVRPGDTLGADAGVTDLAHGRWSC
ncbi:recombinase family protein [Bradyrhizobium sp. 195]